ncbi:TSUP family transporter [Haliea sp.]
MPPALEPTVALLLVACSVLSSMITASLGAGGGVLLLLLMALWLPPAALIPVHGIIQLGSNGGRVLLTWRHIDWRLIAFFAPGVVAGALLGAWLLVELPMWLWQSTIACFVLYLCWGPRLPRMALGAPGTFVAAALTSFASMFVGATGPLVAAFVKQVQRDRFATVATFSAAMTLQHAPKALVFGFAGFVFLDWLVFIAVMISAGLVGTWSGIHLLRYISDRRFAVGLNLLLTLLALRLLWQATAEFLV